MGAAQPTDRSIDRKRYRRARSARPAHRRLEALQNTTRGIRANLHTCGGLAIAGVTLMRHFAQTEADRQRRITESFSKAIEQLGSDKLEVRLGGIYALERISKESPHDYWTVMENLTAFVRERTRQTEAERTASRSISASQRAGYWLWEKPDGRRGTSEEFWASCREEPYGEPPATDIAAVLTVINRRSEAHRAIEARDKRVLDFRQAILRRAELTGAHLEGAVLEAHLEGAFCIVRTRHPQSGASRRHQGGVPQPWGASRRRQPHRGRISKAPTSAGRISNAPASATRISKAPTSLGRISKAPASPRRISKAPASRGASRRRHSARLRG